MEGASSQSNFNVNLVKLLRIIYHNARSLLPKLNELYAVTEAETPDIICIVEISDNELAIDNYQILRLDRDRHGGGVIMYVHSLLCPKILLAGHKNLELLIISISPQNSSCKVCVSLFYRPPSSNLEFFDNLCLVLQSLNPSVYNSFVLLGDFNVNYFCTHSLLYKRLSDCLSPFSLCQVVSSATHRSSRGTTSLIDLAFVPNLSQVSSCSVIYTPSG